MKNIKKQGTISVARRLTLPLVVYSIVVGAMFSLLVAIELPLQYNRFWKQQEGLVHNALQDLNLPPVKVQQIESVLRSLAREGKAPMVARDILIGCSLLLTSLVVFLLFFYGHLKVLVFNPLRLIKETLERRSQADHSAFVPPLPNNEFGQVAVALNKLLEKQDAYRADLEDYTEQLQKSNRELEDFAYIASHDLKEPLRGINNYATFVLEDCGDIIDPESLRRLGTMKSLCQHMDALISSLLHYSQVGTAELTRNPTNIQEVVGDVLKRLEPSLEEKQVTVSLEKPLPIIECDGPRVTEVFANLVTNAIKYNDKATPTIEIGCKAAEGLEPPTFYVKDNGIGIADHHKAKAFQMFRRLHLQEAYGGGTGVGLTIVKKIVEQHHGKVWLESTPGEGTTFFFTLAPRHYYSKHA